MSSTQDLDYLEGSIDLGGGRLLGSTLLIVFVVELLGFPWSKTWASGILEAVLGLKCLV